MTAHRIALSLNGTRHEVEVGAEQLSINLLRDVLGQTGTKEGCSVGVCGACSILVDGALVSACLLPAVFLDGTDVRTVEGLAPSVDELSPLQRAFIQEGGFQCGICTPGQLIAATSLLENIKRPTAKEIRGWMMGNICRCTGYAGIVRAIESAAESTA